MEIFEKNKGKAIMLGNEAIVRGALESGVQFVSTYPGTPASEIGDSFAKIKNNFYFEYSTNEKVALEAGIGASFSGLKTLVAMKNFGLNVASDSLMPFCYTGSNGPFVLVVADDPSCHSSAQSEENSRGFANLAHIPILEPADSQECKDFTKLAFQISEKYKIPVMLRLTTRISHQRMPVVLNKIQNSKVKIKKFIKNPNKYVTMPPRVLEMKKELFEKVRKIKKGIGESFVKTIAGKGNFGIVCSGVSYLYTMEILEELNLKIPVLKVGMFYPLPKEKLLKFIKNLKKVLVVEELEPYLEKEIERIVKNTNCKLKIFGKDLLPEVGELKPEYVLSAVSKILGLKSKLLTTKLPTIKHFPRFCDGCAYWKVFAAIKQLAPKNTVFGGDIGCYMMAAYPPHNLYDYMSSMGSSIGIGHGIKKSTKNKVISFIGDSTFFHAGMPALLNAVENKSNLLVVIMENKITAMTGHQPRPQASIEKIVRALGVKNLKVIDPTKNYQDFIKTAKDFLNKKEVSVIIARHPCWLFYERK